MKPRTLLALLLMGSGALLAGLVSPMATELGAPVGAGAPLAAASCALLGLAATRRARPRALAPALSR